MTATPSRLARLRDAVVVGVATLAAAAVAVQIAVHACGGYFAPTLPEAYEPLLAGRRLGFGLNPTWLEDVAIPPLPDLLWRAITLAGVAWWGPRGETLLFWFPLAGLLAAARALRRRGGAAGLAIALCATGLPLLLSSGGSGGLQLLLLVALLSARGRAAQVGLGLLLPLAGLEASALALLASRGRPWQVVGLGAGALLVAAIVLVWPWPWTTMLPPLGLLPLGPLALFVLAWHWRPKARGAVIALCVLGAVGWGTAQHHLHARAWRIEGQITRFASEWLKGGVVAASPGARLAYVRRFPVAEVGCRGSVELAWACADDDPQAFADAAAALVRRFGVEAVLVDQDWPGHRGPLPVGWSHALTWLDPEHPDERVDLYAVGDPGPLAERARDYGWKLPPGMVGTDTPPQAWQVPTAALSLPGEADAAHCGVGTLVLDLSGEGLVDAEGRVHGGAVIRGAREVVLPGPWPAGHYVLELWAEATVFDGEPALVALRQGERGLVRLEVPEGPGGPVQAAFSLGEASPTPLSLHLLNDRADAEHDRNLHLGQVRVHRVAAPASTWRQERLRQALAGHSVVLVSIDTLRADHLGAYGYDRDTSPVIDGLAAGGVRFEHAVSAAHWTAPSHASLLTGLHPEQHGVTAFPDPGRMGEEVSTLAERLHQRGYATAAFAAGLYVSTDLGLGQGFERWSERVQPAGDRFAEAAAWVAEQDPEQPVFLFVHTYQVHDPYDPPAPYDQRYAPGEGEVAPEHLRQPLAATWFGGARPSPSELRWQEALYDGEIRYTDASLRILLDALRDTGRADRTLVVVTADHGEEFFDHGWVGHGRLYGELLRVPLILSHPALRLHADGLVGQVAGGADVAPTVLDLVAGAAPPDMGGRSLLPAMTGACDPERRAWSSSEMGGDEGISLLGRDVHVLADQGREHLFDVQDDPRERRDLGRDRAEELHTLLEQARAFRGGLQSVAPVTAVQRTDEQIEALRALGYVE